MVHRSSETSIYRWFEGLRSDDRSCHNNIDPWLFGRDDIAIKKKKDIECHLSVINHFYSYMYIFVFLIHWNPAAEVFVSSYCLPVGKFFGRFHFYLGVSDITKVTDSWYLCKWFSLDFLWYLTIQIIKFWIHLCIYCNCYSNILKIVLNHHSLEPYTPIKMEYPMKSKHVAAKNVNKTTGVFTHFVTKKICYTIREL